MFVFERLYRAPESSTITNKNINVGSEKNNEFQEVREFQTVNMGFKP